MRKLPQQLWGFPSLRATLTTKSNLFLNKRISFNHNIRSKLLPAKCTVGIRHVVAKTKLALF